MKIIFNIYQIGLILFYVYYMTIISSNYQVHYCVLIAVVQDGMYKKYSKEILLKTFFRDNYPVGLFIKCLVHPKYLNGSTFCSG